MFFCRDSIARSNGGHTTFIVNQMKAANTIACTNNVRLMLMFCPFADSRVRRLRYWTAVSSGFANAKNMPMPRPIMNDASIRPSSRNTRACNCGINSG